MYVIKKGLDLPILGAPKQIIENAKAVKTVALVGPNYVGMKPSMKVNVGDKVKIGDVLFECKKNEGLLFTSPGAGTVKSINRGAKRVFETLVIELDQNEEHKNFENFKSADLANLGFEAVRDLLIESGLWTALKARPFSKVAPIDERPHSLFITATDSNPLAGSVDAIIKDAKEDFIKGVKILSKLTEGKTFVCTEASSEINISEGSIETHKFSGKHPYGNVGTHIHELDPVGPGKSVWSIGYQDVIAVAKLFATGKLSLERIISLAGPRVANPRLLKTRLGADLKGVIEGELSSGTNRVISGSILNGKKMTDVFHFLGRYDNQVSVIEEDTNREFLGWHAPGLNKFSTKGTFLSKWLPGRLFNITSTTHGSVRAMVPVGVYEKLVPLDVLPTQLLRALATDDTDQAQRLGCLEFDEEDLALCTFASPGKVDFGEMLRRNLEIIEKEG